MATVDVTKPASSSSNRSYDFHAKKRMAVRKISIADITAKKGSAAAANDVVQVFSLKAGDIILSANCFSVTADSGATAVFGITGDDTDGLLSGIDLAATAGSATGTPGAYFQAATAPYALTQGKMLASDDTLDLLLGGTVGTTGVFVIMVEYLAMADLL